MRALWACIAAVAAFALLWMAAEQRRANCMESGRIGCTVLPWSGERPKLSARDCRNDRLRIAAGLMTADQLPAECRDG